MLFFSIIIYRLCPLGSFRENVKIVFSG